MSYQQSDPRTGQGPRVEVTGQEDGRQDTWPVRGDLDSQPTDTHLAAEVAVIGAMILEDGARQGALAMLTSADFGREAHAILFDTIATLHNKGLRPDQILVNDRLAETGKLDVVGNLGSVWLTTSIEGCPVPALWPTYATIVKREADRRRTLDRLRRAIARLESGEDPDVVTADLAVAV